MDSVQQRQLKGLRFIFLRNNEDLPEDAKRILKNMRGDFQDLGDAYMFKEALRSIYVRAKTSYHARITFSPHTPFCPDFGRMSVFATGASEGVNSRYMTERATEQGPAAAERRAKKSFGRVRNNRSPKRFPAPCYSPIVNCTVPSPLGSLTTVFGKGTCVATPL